MKAFQEYSNLEVIAWLLHRHGPLTARQCREALWRRKYGIEPTETSRTGSSFSGWCTSYFSRSDYGSRGDYWYVVDHDAPYNAARWLVTDEGYHALIANQEAPDFEWLLKSPEDYGYANYTEEQIDLCTNPPDVIDEEIIEETHESRVNPSPPVVEYENNNTNDLDNVREENTKMSTEAQEQAVEILTAVVEDVLYEAVYDFAMDHTNNGDSADRAAADFVRAALTPGKASDIAFQEAFQAIANGSYDPVEECEDCDCDTGTDWVGEASDVAQALADKLNISIEKAQSYVDVERAIANKLGINV